MKIGRLFRSLRWNLMHFIHWTLANVTGVICKHCKGNGYEPGYCAVDDEPDPCSDCLGFGKSNSISKCMASYMNENGYGTWYDNY